MPFYLGIDTSNYTTSAALYDTESGVVCHRKQLLTVHPGERGLRQSDAVFQHTRQLPILIEDLFSRNTYPLIAVGVSAFPRRVKDSYMPCFLVGDGVARSIAAAHRLPLHRFSHQEGHIAAALYSCGRLDLLEHGDFIAFHFSGGTTECLHCTAEQGVLSVESFAHTSDLNTGQVIDRIGVRMGMQFPCGPELERLAMESQKAFRVHPSFRDGDPSLSGLENQAERMLASGEEPADVAKYVLDFVLAVVERITQNALAAFGPLPLIYAGGVMSNRYISGIIQTRYGGIFAQPEFSSDNAAGIAVLAARQEGK